MAEPLTNDNLHEQLTAFADHELDPAQTLAVWRHLSEHPGRMAAIEWLQDQQQLSIAAKSMLDVQVPADFRSRMIALVNDEPVESPTLLEESIVARTTRPPRVGRMIAYSLLAAACILIGVMTAVFFVTRAGSAVLPAQLVADVSRIHSECARLPEALHNAEFEQVSPSIYAAAKQDLGNFSNAPDFTKLGYRFVGSGPCPAVDFEAVHLLYRSMKPASVSALSLFVQHDGGQYPHLLAGRVYRVSSPASPFPLMAWRSGGNVYLLMADTDAIEAKALDEIHAVDPAKVLPASL